MARVAFLERPSQCTDLYSVSALFACPVWVNLPDSSHHGFPAVMPPSPSPSPTVSESKGKFGKILLDKTREKKRGRTFWASKSDDHPPRGRGRSVSEEERNHLESTAGGPLQTNVVTLEMEGVGKNFFPLGDKHCVLSICPKGTRDSWKL